MVILPIGEFAISPEAITFTEGAKIKDYCPHYLATSFPPVKYSAISFPSPEKSTVN